MHPHDIPAHLRRYLAEQDYSRYSAIDQSVWRYIMRRLKNFLSNNAHTCYLEGLVKTGISTEAIPKISEMSEKLKAYRWRAVAVNGFIPPAAFMELQSIGILPIACDMRSIEHVMYTPAPDIVHEAAGHAPILIDDEFNEYLREYAQVAKLAILNKEDLDIYAAIRELSDLKENPTATEIQIADASKKLELAQKAAIEPSEAALLARMNWWTAEYGLIGDINSPKIYGAGLLSSVGESHSALQQKTKKIPFSLDCLNYSYDITEPQPQLFVTPNFKTLTQALQEFAKQMAFVRGGEFGLQLAKKSHVANTIEYDSGLQISGTLKDFIAANNNPVYLQFEGPCQLSYRDSQIPGQDRKRHAHGFGAPIGKIKNDLAMLKPQTAVKLEFDSGVKVEGQIESIETRDKKIILVTWSQCSVSLGGRELFKPEWGPFDMPMGTKITSVFGGVADRGAYGHQDDYHVKHLAHHRDTPKRKALNEIYSRIRKYRETKVTETELETLIDQLDNGYQDDWLARLEVFELATRLKLEPKSLKSIENFLKSLSTQDSADGVCVRDGLALIELGI